MGKTKNKGTQNLKAVVQQRIQRTKNSLIQKNKNLKNISDHTIVLNKSKTQNEDILIQITAGTHCSYYFNLNMLQELSLKETNNISNNLLNHPTLMKLILNINRNFKEKFNYTKVDISDPNIFKVTLLQNNLKDRDGSYEKEESDSIISNLKKSIGCKDFDDDKDVNNDVKADDITRIDDISEDKDTTIERKDITLGKCIVDYPIEIDRTRVVVTYNDTSSTSSLPAEIKEKLVKFGSIEQILFTSNDSTRVINGQLLKSIIVFITYYSPISARKAFSMDGQKYGDNYITVCYVDFYCPLLVDKRKCIYLSELPYDIDNNTIWKLFSTYGEIEYVHILRNVSGFSIGIGWVVFTTEDAVKKAIELHGTVVLSQPIIVKNYSTDLFRLREVEKVIHKKVEKVLAKHQKEYSPYKSNNNLSKEVKNNSGKAIACEVKIKEDQES